MLHNVRQFLWCLATLRTLALAGAFLRAPNGNNGAGGGAFVDWPSKLNFVYGAAAASPSANTAPPIGNSTLAANQMQPAPYWHRPGCHQVGHTRTISIPGCVKFNISTNACRGFCMSFSIPAAEDIGPPPQPLIDADGQLVELLALGDPNSVNSATGANNNNNNIQVATATATASALGIASGQPKWADYIGRAPLGPSGSGSLARTTTTTSSLSTSSMASTTLDELAHLGGSKSPLAGTVGNTNDKHDVVSVGQCCSMMETEDVTVNLRCGINETRRLVFKSAKTCECFFCKHV